jgi:hypothetical protein
VPTNPWEQRCTTARYLEYPSFLYCAFVAAREFRCSFPLSMMSDMAVSPKVDLALRTNSDVVDLALDGNEDFDLTSEVTINDIHALSGEHSANLLCQHHPSRPPPRRPPNSDPNSCSRRHDQPSYACRPPNVPLSLRRRLLLQRTQVPPCRP